MTTETNNNAEGQEENGGDDFLESAGEILRTERERLGYSEKEVADRLHITMHYVRAIETDCYEKLPGIVFARGYIRSYAELLELDRDRLVELFNTRVGEQSRYAGQAALDRRRRNARGRLVPWLILALLAFGGGFLVFWAYHALQSSGEGVLTGIDCRETVPSANEPVTDWWRCRQLAPDCAEPCAGDARLHLGDLHKADVLLTIAGRVRYRELPPGVSATVGRFIGLGYRVDVNSGIDDTARSLASI